MWVQIDPIAISLDLVFWVVVGFSSNFWYEVGIPQVASFGYFTMKGGWNAFRRLAIFGFLRTWIRVHRE